MEDPLMTISAGGQHHGVVSAFLSRQFGGSVGHEADAPLGTVTAGGGGKSALVECALSPDDEAGALRVAAFLILYYGEGGQWGDLYDPMATITTKDRLALVTVHVEGTPYVIVDIGLRMLQPRELYRAQGFPDTYIIDHGHDGRKFSKSAQVRMCGNSVSPPPAIALIRANYTDASGKRMVA
jgi:Site-specific DNA methylase